MRPSFASRHFSFLLPTTLLGLALLAAPVKSWAFSAEGHEIVADIAELQLQKNANGQAVLARIQAILPPGETMATASTWADRIKGGAGFAPPPADAAELLDKVNAKFGNTRAHNPWHYVDVPLGATGYSRLDYWTRPDDVVQMIRICAQTLRAGAPPADAPVALSQREALRLLIHYVGDEHQPLHVGCAYLEKNGTQMVMPTTQDLVTGRVVDDQGGNALTLTVNGTPVVDDRGRAKKLHAYWDFDTVRNALTQAGQTPDDYARTLVAIAPEADWNATGNMKYWPKQWADDTLRQSKIAYNGVVVTAKTENGWNIVVPPNYDQTSATLIKTQLAKGGYRLAQILEAALGTP